MSNYKITFKGSNGKIRMDYFYGANKYEAITAFHACYRHDNYEIISIEIEE